jgi:putative RNA 2'-phosphotransferase
MGGRDRPRRQERAVARDQRVEHSKKMSWLLRHAASSQGVTMDAAGWVEIAEVLRALRLSREQLDAAVRDNSKARFEVDGSRIRATQGHSTAPGAVSLDALEASWTQYDGAGPLWHGTNIAAIEGIAREGILPVSRTHVHLAAAVDSQVGKRANVAVLLEVSVGRLRDAGIAAFVSPNGVILVRRVPVDCIVGLVGVTREGRLREAELRALFVSDSRSG